MASDPQDTVSNAAVDAITVVEAGRLGFSNLPSMSTMFPASPVLKGELNDVESKYFDGGKYTGDEVTIDGLNGIVTNGHGFSENVDLNYTKAPDMVVANAGKAGGHPSNAYVPNPTSPGGTIGVPNDNPESKPAPPASFTAMNGFGGATGGGPSAIDSLGLPITPRAAATEISNSTKSYPRGESAWSSAQKIDSQAPTDANED